MKHQDITKTSSQVLRDSMAALKRAGTLARKTAIQTNTHLVIVKDGEVVRISPDQLRREMQDDRNP